MARPSTQKKANNKKAKAKKKALVVVDNTGEERNKKEGLSSRPFTKNNVQDDTHDHAGEDDAVNDKATERAGVPTTNGEQQLTTTTTTTINHELLVLQNEGLKVVAQQHPRLGRIVVASKTFDVGSSPTTTTRLYTTILSETPALVSTVGDHLEFLEQFLSAPEHIQLGILDMYHQPLDDSSPMCQSLKESAKVLYMLGVLDDLALIHRLLSISATNAYRFQDGLSALFLFGSKLSHSCHPNVAYTSARGKLEFRLIQPSIASGEEVTSSYLSDLYETPTFLRQKELMQTKAFLCQCQRCCRPDDCRVAQCPHCRTPIAPISRMTEDPHLDTILDGSIWQWICTECNTLDVSDAIRSKETAIAKLLEGLESAVNNAIEQQEEPGMTQVTLPCTPEQIQDIIHHCCSQLSSIHYLTLQAYRLLTTVATAQAYQYMQDYTMICRPTGDTGFVDENQKKMIEPFQTSLEAGLHHVLGTECVAVECRGTCRGNDIVGQEESSLWFPHAPLFDRGATMLHMADDLHHIPRSKWPQRADPMLRRYLPILRAKYGDNDSRIRDIGQMLSSQRRYY